MVSSLFIELLGAIVEVLGTDYFGQVLRDVPRGHIILNTGNIHTLILLMRILISLMFTLQILLLYVIILVNTHLRHSLHHQTLEGR